MDGRKERNLSFLRGGYYDTSVGPYFYNNAGYYREPKISSDAGAYVLGFYSTGLLPQYSGGKGFGYSIRCVVKP